MQLPCGVAGAVAVSQEAPLFTTHAPLLLHDRQGPLHPPWQQRPPWQTFELHWLALLQWRRGPLGVAVALHAEAAGALGVAAAAGRCSGCRCSPCGGRSCGRPGPCSDRRLAGGLADLVVRAGVAAGACAHTVPFGYFWQAPMPLHLPLSPHMAAPASLHIPLGQRRWPAWGCTCRGRWAGRRSGKRRAGVLAADALDAEAAATLVAAGAVLAVAALAAAAAGADRGGHALRVGGAGGDAGAVLAGGRLARDGNAHDAHPLRRRRRWGERTSRGPRRRPACRPCPGRTWRSRPGRCRSRSDRRSRAGPPGRCRAGSSAPAAHRGALAHLLGLVAADAGAGAGDVAADAVAAEPGVHSPRARHSCCRRPRLPPQAAPVQQTPS